MSFDLLNYGEAVAGAMKEEGPKTREWGIDFCVLSLLLLLCAKAQKVFLQKSFGFMTRTEKTSRSIFGEIPVLF